MKNETIKCLIAKSEDSTIEFKRARGGVPADFWPSYSQKYEPDRTKVTVEFETEESEVWVKPTQVKEKIREVKV